MAANSPAPAPGARRDWLRMALGFALPAVASPRLWADPPALAAPASAASAPTGAGQVEDELKRWIDRPVMEQAALSGDGRHLAAIGYGGGLPVAYVVDLDSQAIKTLTPTDITAGYRFRRGIYPAAVRWIGDGLLLLHMSTGDCTVRRPDGRLVRSLEGVYVDRLADADDGAVRVLVAAEDEMHIVNLRSGARIKADIDLPMDELIAMAFDAQGRLRAATTYKASIWSGKELIRQWYRPPGDKAKWQLLESATDIEHLWRPLRVLSDSETLAVLARGDRDTYAVFRYDPVAKRLGEVMAGHASDDIVSTVGLDAPMLESVVTGGLKRQVYWFDERWIRLQKSIDLSLPGSLNALSGQPDGHVLVHSRSDVDPGRWFALDTKAMRLREIGEARPGIDPARMRPMAAMRYRARDGLSIPAYLTRPAGEGPAPMIVLIHGGPWARDDWGWDEEVQLLASRGYAVFQPQFRGSTGFGRAYEKAGYRQWGLAMQDDITDGVNQLVAQGVADPRRMAIVGGSYGGYAAMWGLVKTPELYRCAVSFAGISDLTDLLKNHLYDDSTAASRARARQLVGDPDIAKAGLDAVSPLRHAHLIQAPLLLIHGEEDRRVLPEQSEWMVKALRRLGKSVEWLPFPDAGHGLYWDHDRRRYFETVLAFLARHLDTPA